MSVPLIDIPIKPTCAAFKRLLVLRNRETERVLERLAKRRERKLQRAEAHAARQAGASRANTLAVVCIGEMLAFIGLCAIYADLGFGWIATA